ncbi:MAG: hypothetical protein WBF90_12935 [Rivularia sp. (in: cyanobacteria)]
MFKFLFDCSAFEISTSIQAVNNILFPVVLFVIIFWLMCEVFLVDIAVDEKLPMMNKEFMSGTIKIQVDENIFNKEDASHIQNLLSHRSANIDNYKTEMEVLDIYRELQNIKA